MPLPLSILIIVVLLVLIVKVCELFTNAIEWVGERFKLSKGAVGSVLAAVGTALPETLVPIVAIVSGLIAGSGVSGEASHEIGIGAILGAPFLLSTLAMFVSGVAVAWFARTRGRPLALHLDQHLFIRDLRYFFLAYIPAILVAWIPVPAVKIFMAIGLVAFYGVYVVRTLQKEHMADTEFDMEPLIFDKKQAEPATGKIMLQLLVSLAGILVLAQLFVGQISHVAEVLQISPLVISLIICPIATELPEKFNSVTWIGQRKDVMALGNITGAMVFQSCIPTAVALLFTPWELHAQAMISVLICLVSSGFIYLFAFRWPDKPERQAVVFLSGGVFYLIYLLVILLPLLN